ncbi:VOC family protein [Phenylobacterium sp.]|uniref:VOC family protein n=1 Tax=Phenylobacterium sp. TaxID=1871053 RepID=UPI0025FCC3BA|nr:VOC family protein [Phenylobacterium sp.]MBX3483497.1 VOC family protein [Phenylobacterium sp.]MCW5761097.1 VOC family protein [Phenylobacterium sp.]
MALINGLDHVNIRTADLAGTKAFLIDVLGLAEGWRPPFPFPGAWLYAGDKDVVHLVEVEAPAAASAGSSLDHFAFDIADYDDALARVEKTGFRFRATTTPGTTVKQIFVRDPNGVTIELNWKGDRPKG